MNVQHRPRGFTLVELMVVLAVLAVLLAIGLPSFRSTMDATRLTTGTNELIAAISLARTEAMRSTRPSLVCPSANGTTCGSNWNAGLMVGTDANSDGTPETAIRYVQAKERLTLNVSGGVNPLRIHFDSRGRPATNGVNLVFRVEPSPCPAGEQFRRTLTLTAAGQVNMQKGSCP